MYKTIKIHSNSDAVTMLDDLGPMLEMLLYGDDHVLSSKPYSYSVLSSMAIQAMYERLIDDLVEKYGYGWKARLEKAMHPFSEK